MLYEKLIAYFETKYNHSSFAADVYEVDPETGVGRVPKFTNGDLVRHRLSGRKAKYLTPAFWEKRKGMSLIHYLDKPFKVDHKFGYDYVDDDSIEKIHDR